MKKLFLLVIFSLLVPVLVMAQTATTSEMKIIPLTLGEIVSANDLGSVQPKILPNSPWYWAKSLWRSARLIMTKDPVQKAEARLAIANERLLELQQLVDQGAITKVELQSILNKYDQEIEKLNAKLSSSPGEQKDQIDDFLDKFTGQEFSRQKLLEQLALRLEETDEGVIIEKARQKSLKQFGVLLENLDKDKTQERLEKFLTGQELAEFKSLYNLEILKQLEQQVPPEIQPAVLKARLAVLKKLGRDFAALTYEQKVEKIKDFLDQAVDHQSAEQILQKADQEINNVFPGLVNILDQANIRIRQELKDNNIKLKPGQNNVNSSSIEAVE
jgi:hypothetical protein